MPSIEDILAKEHDISDLLSEEEQLAIVYDIKQTTEHDKGTMAHWLDDAEDALELIDMERKTLDIPIPNAPKDKYPLLLDTVLLIVAKLAPPFKDGKKVVSLTTLGLPSEFKDERADRESRYMSYDLLKYSAWNRAIEKWITTFATTGTAFLKPYHNHVTGRKVLYACAYNEIIVNHSIASLEEAPRITHVMRWNRQRIIQMQRYGIVHEFELPKLGNTDNNDFLGKDQCFDVYEQVVRKDLDDDGIDEPYIITIIPKLNLLVSIQKNFTESMIARNEDTQQIKKIDAFPVYVDLHGICNPDGGFWSLGLYHLVGGINNGINQCLRSLLISAFLANTKTLVKTGTGYFEDQQMSLVPGVVNEIKGSMDRPIGDILQELNFSEPSQTLLTLMQIMINSGEKLVNATNFARGLEAQPNTPGVTTMALMKENQEKPNLLMTHIYDSVQTLLTILYRLYATYLDGEEYVKFVDVPQEQLEYDFDLESMDICPVADPRLSNDVENMMKLQQVMQYVPMGVAPVPILRDLIKAMKFDPTKLEVYVPEPDPNAPPPPESQKAMAEAASIQLRDQLAQKDYELKAMKQAFDQQIKVVSTAAQAEQSKAIGINQIAQAEAAIKSADTNRLALQVDNLETIDD